MEKNINSRINARANAANRIKAFGYLSNRNIFETSFDINGTPIYSELYRYERFKNYNNHTVFYN